MYALEVSSMLIFFWTKTMSFNGRFALNKLLNRTFSQYVRFYASDFTQGSCHGANTPN
jgi:hypothetical protein